MARLVKPLTDTKIKNAKPKDKDYKLFDGSGLFIIISKNGGKWWRFKYKFQKDKVISLGTYPEVTLSQAREKREEYRSLVANGIDPKNYIEDKKQKSTTNIFETVARDWLHHVSLSHSKDYNKRIKLQLEKNIFPYCQNKQIEEITKDSWIDIFNIMSERNIHETLHRMLNYVDRIYQFAISRDICDLNPISLIDKKHHFPPPPKRNYPFISDPKILKKLLQNIKEYDGYDITRYALMILPHVFVRPFNLRHMLWDEIDFDTKIWTIPAKKMKMKRKHLVPLSSQVITILEQIPRLSNYVFPSPRSNSQPLSDGTLNNALKNMGWTSDILVPHSFRHTASTLLHENIHIHKISSEVIEIQMAHSQNNKVKATYNHAEYFKERIKLMNWWSSYLENLYN